MRLVKIHRDRLSNNGQSQWTITDFVHVFI